MFAIRTKSFWLYPDWLYKLTNYYKDQQETVKVTTTFAEEVKLQYPNITTRVVFTIKEDMMSISLKRMNAI